MTSYKNIDVRSMELLGVGGIRFQIWIDSPSENGMIGVHIWNYKKYRADYEVTIKNLFKCLDDAWHAALEQCTVPR